MIEENYLALYGDKKKEDIILFKSMFKNAKQISLGWTHIDYINNISFIENQLKYNNISQIIFLGLEIGWDKLILYIKENYKNIKIKIICTTLESLLYYNYERENFFNLLKLSKKNKIDNIAFLRKGQYQLYKKLNYNCSFLMENYTLNYNKLSKLDNKKINIGIYPLNYTWDKNIFNQLSIGKFIDTCLINYNLLDKKMAEFLEIMHIPNKPIDIKNICEKELINQLLKNDINVSCSFTEYFHPIFFISMELGIPCLLSNTVDFKLTPFLEEFLITNCEDNPFINAKKIQLILSNKNKIMSEYKIWKNEYDKKARTNLLNFLEK